MQTYITKSVFRTFFAIAGLVILGTTAMASDVPEGVQIVDGVAIYLGVVPAQIVQGHAKGHEESKMHGGIPGKGHRDHIVVALFDSNSGQRIENAEVSGVLMEVGSGKQQKKLESMTIADTITYGNYFYMPDRSTYHIQIQVVRRGKAAIVAKFTHRHFDK